MTTTPHALDASSLSRWMREHVPHYDGGPLEIDKFPGGQSNPTYRVRSGPHSYVLRRKPPGKLLPSAHAVDREFRVITALHGTAVPVARPHALCEDERVIGTAFYLMDYVEGRIFWDASLPELARGDRLAIYDEMCRVLAALHRVDPDAAGLGDYGRPDAYVQRQIARWTRQYRASETERIDAMEQLIEHLPRHVPGGEERTIVHGDYRLDNAIFHPSEPRVLAVLDWELSTLGHPLVDAAYYGMRWRLGKAFRGLGDENPAELCIPTESQFFSQYCTLTGRSRLAPTDWEFYIAFNMFRLAGILQGVLSRALQGNASNARALEAGSRARPLAEQGWLILQHAFGI